MRAHTRIGHFAARRFERLEAHASAWGWTIGLTGSGWDVDGGGADPIGSVLLTGIHQLDTRSRVRDEDHPVRFFLVEHWTPDVQGDVQVEEGCSLVRCHYQGKAGARGVRYCYVPDSPRPAHWHPPNAPTDHRPHDHLIAEEAMAHFERFVAEELLAERLRVP